MPEVLKGIDLAWLNLPDRDLAIRVIAHWMGNIAIKEGIQPSELSEKDATAIYALMSRVETDNDLELERIFHVLAEGNLDRGGRLFRSYLGKLAKNIIDIDEAKTGRRKQKANAKKPRAEALQGVVNAIVFNKPHIKHAELIDELRYLQGPNNVVDEVAEDEEFIYWRANTKCKQLRKTSFKRLYDVLAQAKKKNHPR